MTTKWLDIEIDDGFWSRFYLPFSLVLIGSVEDDHFNLAPKHLAMPLSWKNDFGFICTPLHKTYQNIKLNKTFTVSYPKSEQLALASLASSPRSDEDSNKSILDQIATSPAKKIKGIILKDAFLVYECKLTKIYDDFGENSLIAGKIIHAYADENYLRHYDQDQQQMIYDHPLPVYLHPDRYSIVEKTALFPFPEGFKKC